jgi:hypothetical protein
VADKVKNQIVKFFSNGGKRDVFYLTLIGSIILFLMRTSATFGEYKNKWDTIESRVTKIECIEQDIKEMRNDIAWIKMYIKGEIR